MSLRDVGEVAARNQLNRLVRVPAWRRAARSALAGLEPDAEPWLEGIRAWLAGRDDPQLSRARELVERERRAMLHESTSVRDGKTALRDIANACNKMSSPRQLGELLFWLIKTSGASQVLELGTALGHSAAYMAAALPAGGRLLTVERRPVVAERARRLFAVVGVADRVEVEVGNFFRIAQRRFGDRRFDAMFKDGGHTRKATEEFFETWAPHCRAGAMVVFDDIDHARERQRDGGMPRAWREIAASPRVRTAVGLGRPGVISLR